MASTARTADDLERALVAHHARFLDFLTPRVGNRAEAEEILQSAYVRALEKGLPADDDTALVTWFHRVLRNAAIDAARRRGAEARGLDRFAQEEPRNDEQPLREAVCACVHDLLPGLKPEYADVVRSVDLDGRSLQEVAAEHAITVNNASVRLHRARRRLKEQLLRSCGACATHGCLDCHCRTSASRLAD